MVMKTPLVKLALGLCALGLASLASAQRNNEIQLRAGLGWGLYVVNNEWTYTLDNFSYTETGSDAGVTIQLPIELRYEFHRLFNAGIDLKFGSYLYDPDDPETQDDSNDFTTVGISAEFTPLSTNTFRLYLGVNLNATQLNMIDGADLSGDNETQTLKWRGGGMQLNLGFMAFFSKPVGFNFNLGFDRHRFDLKDYLREGEVQDLTGFTGAFETGGLNGTIGLVIRFRR
jgi:hypothetical protein